MNHEVKTKWVAALRSGDYRQGRGKLRDLECETPRHCCLGVLSDIYYKEIGEAWPEVPFGALSPGLPTKDVRLWSGLSFLGASDDKVVLNRFTLPLHIHNDQGSSFADIADAIESQL